MSFTMSTIKRGTFLLARRMLSLKKMPEKIKVSQVSVKDNKVEIRKIREIDWSIPNIYKEEIENKNFQIIKYRGYELLINSNYNSY